MAHVGIGHSTGSIWNPMDSLTSAAKVERLSDLKYYDEDMNDLRLQGIFPKGHLAHAAHQAEK
eukprot:6474750-Amphidinium_carterae.1